MVGNRENIPDVAVNRDYKKATALMIIEKGGAIDIKLLQNDRSCVESFRM